MLSANKTSSPLSLKEKNSSKEEIEIGDDEDGSWEDWEGGSEEPCLCPVCPCTDATPARIFRHCVETHSLDLHEIVSEIASNKQIVARGLEEEEMARIYTGMKLVNYLRRIGGGGGGTSTTTSITQAGIIAAASIWAHSEEFLKPVLESDAMLYAFDDLYGDDDDDNENVKLSKQSSSSTNNHSNASLTSDELIKLFKTPLNNQMDKQQLLLRCQASEFKCQQLSQELANVVEGFKQFKDMVKEKVLVAGISSNDRLLDSSSPSTSNNTAATAAATSNPSSDEPETPTQKKEERGEVEEEEEQGDWEMDYYFNSYAGNDIHESMLKDTVRTEAYRDFIYENKASVFKDKIVMDVGCGTGILSMFAARAGAKKVIAIDNSTIIRKARKNIAENGLDHIIFCMQGSVEDIVKSSGDMGGLVLSDGSVIEQVDIIISEWMGYFLLFEGMLDSVIVARDHFLAVDGFMAPSHSEIILAAMDAEDIINDSYHFWNDVYGFKMSSMKKGFHSEALVDFTPSSTILSPPTTLKKINMNTDTTRSLDFSTPFSLTFNTNGWFSGFCGWFDILFDAEGDDVEKIAFSTGPHAKGTHWKQTMFIFEKGMQVDQGMTVTGTFKCVKSTENHRELVAEIEFKVVDCNGNTIDERPVQTFQIR